MPRSKLFARFHATAVIGLCLAAAQPAAAVDYVEAPPLGEAIDPSVRDCRATDTLNVPLITWGADLATIHANGGAAETQRGSLFDEAGLRVRLQRQDDFKAQVEAYLRCDSPFLRATMGMAGMVADLAQADPRTEMVAIYQLSWSNGGDALVVDAGIARPENLAGRTIALQAYGPHVDYLMTVLGDAGLSADDVTLRWTRDLVGFAGSAPAAALHDDQAVDAAMVIIPDALALTSGGAGGDGSEDSVRGAQILLSTRSASRVIADVYLVRADYLAEHRDQVQAFVHALMQAEEETRALMRRPGRERDALLAAGGRILLDAADAVADTEALWADAETVGWTGNVRFFGEEGYARGFARLVPAIQAQLVDIGLL
ncbi:MAG: ABC transporter substrate-binding protein, partial [Alphaproteobacteria bacterium]